MRRKLSVASLRFVCCLTVLFGAVTSVLAQGSQTLRVVPLVRDEHVLVSFELAGGLTDEVRNAIRSGLKTTFTYTVELRLDVPAWVDRSISTAVVATSVEYDNLTRTHKVVRVLDGRVEDSISTQDEDVVRGWMTNVNRFPLFSTLGPRAQPRLLHPRQRYRAPEQRVDLLALRQRTVCPISIHVHTVNGKYELPTTKYQDLGSWELTSDRW